MCQVAHGSTHAPKAFCRALRDTWYLSVSLWRYMQGLRKQSYSSPSAGALEATKRLLPSLISRLPLGPSSDIEVCWCSAAKDIHTYQNWLGWCPSFPSTRSGVTKSEQERVLCTAPRGKYPPVSLRTDLRVSCPTFSPPKTHFKGTGSTASSNQVPRLPIQRKKLLGPIHIQGKRRE